MTKEQLLKLNKRNLQFRYITVKFRYDNLIDMEADVLANPFRGPYSKKYKRIERLRQKTKLELSYIELLLETT